MSKPLLIANWKVNPRNSREAFDLASAVQNGLQGVGVDVVLCPPFVYIPQILNTAYQIQVGGQDCFWEGEGAYTGEISAQMLKNLGCSYVILGHSERKQLGETLEMVHKKVKAALMVGLIPVVCIGEKIEEEMKIIFHGIKNWKLEIKNLVLVYEPDWAISTAKNSKPDTPQHVKKVIEKMKKIAGNDVNVLYGGSVDSKRIAGFMESGAQGALVGAASLNAQEFIQLAKNAISR